MQRHSLLVDSGDNAVSEANVVGDETQVVKTPSHGFLKEPHLPLSTGSLCGEAVL